MKKDSVKAKYDILVDSVKRYVVAVRTLKVQGAGSFPAYGNPGEENKPGKSQPNVVFIKDLITQVQTAYQLGYVTQLTSDGGTLTINFVERYPYIPIDMQILT